MRIEAYARLSEFPAELAGAWNALLAPDHVTQGMDVTATFEWHAALMEAFVEEGAASVLVAYDPQGQVAGILPLCRPGAGGARGPRGRIAMLPELYGGRYGLLLRHRSGDVLRALLARANQVCSGWTGLEVTLPDGNGELDFMAGAAPEHWLGIATRSIGRSPYIVLPDRFDDYLKTLKPNFRTEVRRGERRLSETGTLRRRLFRSPADVVPLWDAIGEIERRSWKEAAGTSVTTHPEQERFYRSLLPRAAAAGQLFSTVLYVDERPIAHQLCLCRDATAAILKMSYVEDLKRHYPASVLLSGYIRDLIDSGFRYLDFMGECEEFKMRWAHLTYGRTQCVFFRRSLGGRWAYWRRRAADTVNRVRSGSNPSILRRLPSRSGP